ncbi:MAG: hypothetical protein V7672_09480 [Brevundimonas sp.]|uniref:hypothetical protein n=1 Tax=Brevundimonas sp. TaxID=1871086 RepID=UPI0030019247
MNDQRAAARLEEHASRMKPFFEEMERLERVTPSAGQDQLKLPYTSRPVLPGSGFKMTFSA